MPNDPITAGNGPWRILVLDRDPADPKWILAARSHPGRRAARMAQWHRGPGHRRMGRHGHWPVPADAYPPAPHGPLAHRRTTTGELKPRPQGRGIVAEAMAETPAETRATDVHRIS